MEHLTVEEAIQWRYAPKRMNSKKIPSHDVKKVMDAIRYAPSSRGLQPFRILVIEDLGLRSSILPIADDQPQIMECSHLLVFATWSSISLEQIEQFITFASSERGIPPQKLDKMKGMLIKDQLNMSKEQFHQWASRQAYIALSFGMLAAAANQIDAAAMEGFDAKALDELLGLESLGLRSSVLLALGYRDEEHDWNLKLKKVRRSMDELFLKIG